MVVTDHGLLPLLRVQQTPYDVTRDIDQVNRRLTLLFLKVSLPIYAHFVSKHLSTQVNIHCENSIDENNNFIGIRESAVERGLQISDH